MQYFDISGGGGRGGGSMHTICPHQELVNNIKPFLASESGVRQKSKIISKSSIAHRYVDCFETVKRVLKEQVTLANRATAEK